MTEEERQRIIRELEAQVLGSTKEQDKIKKCEVCGQELIKGDCLDHALHIRMHHNALARMRELEN